MVLTGGTHGSLLISSEFCLSIILLDFLLLLNSLFSCMESLPKLFVILILFLIVFFPVMEFLLFLRVFILQVFDLAGHLFPSLVVALLNFLVFIENGFATNILLLQGLENVLLFDGHHLLNLFLLLFQFNRISYGGIVLRLFLTCHVVCGHI